MGVGHKQGLLHPRNHVSNEQPLTILEFAVSSTGQSIIAGRDLPLPSYEAMRPLRASYRAVRRSGRLPAWFSLIGIIIPSALQINIAEANFTAGRFAITLLLIPALVALFKARRRVLLSDLVAALTAIWMVVSASYAAGVGSTISATA